jgi:hypothetical protein
MGTSFPCHYWYPPVGPTSYSSLGGYQGYGISKKGNLMAYISNFSVLKSPKNAEKIQKKFKNTTKFK